MSQKKKLTLTIESDLIESAKLVAEHKGESLSAIIENFLKTLSVDEREGDWLDRFHKKYLPKNYKGPSREQIKKLLDERADKYL